MLKFLVLTVALALPGVDLLAQAEFKIEQPTFEVPVPRAERAEEKPGPPEPVRYSGDPITPPAMCEAIDEYFAAICNDRDSCEMLLELVHVEETTSGVVAVGEIHTTAENVSSIMLLSEDGGESWSEPTDRIPRATFEKALFSDRDTGWAAGTSGEAGAGQRTFFAVTTDGGKKWRRFDVRAGGEERSGRIVDFRFDTPKHGYLILEKAASTDRFELYETFNGARSWSTRGLTPERPKFPGRRRTVDESNWRVEEEPDSGVYLIQGREEESAPWTTRARFAASLGACP